MNKFLSFFVLISSALILFASISIYLATQTGNLDISKEGKQESARQVLVNKEGDRKYTQGSCNTDSDCVPAGCSSQICSNDPGIITTCEYSEDFPSEEVYSCGCVEGACAWYK